MTSRVYSALDARTIGPGLLLDSGLTIVTTSAAALSNSRKVMGTVPHEVGEGSFEAYVYSDSRTALGTSVSIGIAVLGSLSNKATGEDSDSWGYFPGTGEIRNGNVVVASASISPERLCIGVYCSSTNGRVEWFVSGNWIGATTFKAGLSIVPSLTVSGGNAGDRKIYFRSAPPFDFPRIVSG